MSTPETPEETSTPAPSEEDPRRPDRPGPRRETKNMHIEDATPPPED